MDPFATLGLPRRYEIDLDQLESRYRELQRALHPDRHAGASASQRRMSMLKAVEVNDAYRAVKDELRRAEALLALYDGARAAGGPEPEEDPDFLIEMLELREALAEAKESNHAARVQELHAKVDRMRADAQRALGQAFAAVAAASSGIAPALRGDAMAMQPIPASELEPVRRLIGRLKYYRRFLDEVAALHEEGLV